MKNQPVTKSMNVDRVIEVRKGHCLMCGAKRDLYQIWVPGTGRMRILCRPCYEVEQRQLCLFVGKYEAYLPNRGRQP